MSFVWSYPAVIVSVHDGDSVTVDLQMSALETIKSAEIRAEGIDAIERSHKFGAEARAFAAALLPVGTAVILTHRRKEKFGRFLARITLPDGSDFSDHMLTALASDGVTRFAVPYLT